MNSFEQANPHCLNHIFDASSSREVFASEDIVDANGVMLLAQGKPISADLKAKLDQRRLRAPLETTLSIADSLTTSMVFDQAQILMAGNPALTHFAGSRLALASLSRLRLVRLPGPIRLLLTLAHDRLPRSYQHALATTLICAGFAASARLSDTDTEILLVCGLLHDLGEMYLSPDYMTKSGGLNMSEWASVASHPLTGRAIAQEIGHLPEAVAKGIVEHHERMDGSGYPRMIDRTQIGFAGAIVGSADATAAMILRGEPGDAYQAALALRIIPEEFEYRSSSWIISTMRDLTGEAPRQTADPKIIQEALTRSSAAESAAARIAAGPLGSSVESRLTLHLLGNISKAGRSTGLSLLDSMGCSYEDAGGEAFCVARELIWRMRNLGRNLGIRLGSHEGRIMEAWAPLLEALSGGEAVQGATEPMAVT